ncbi:MAG TPA: protein-disulfide reductase DsbD domain-containing protein [Vicinamibacteria bacterium]|nr:protein-disulfide reductase DsbD domain-containing protein [Vicinamibacteria bacterium]
MLQGEGGQGGQEFRTDHFTLRTSVSNTEIAPGQRFTLALDVEMKPHRHAYAPGAEGYRALNLRLDATKILEPHPTLFPAPRPYHFAPLKETVPVFEGRFRILKDVTLSFWEGRSRVSEAPEAPLEITGALEHQVCSDTVCYPPGSIPLRWRVKIRRFVR